MPLFATMNRVIIIIKKYKSVHFDEISNMHKHKKLCLNKPILLDSDFRHFNKLKITLKIYNCTRIHKSFISLLIEV